MIILNYKSKKQLRENLGEPLDYTETSISGNEVSANCDVVGCNRPQLAGYPKHFQRKGREFFAGIKIVNSLIFMVR